MEQQQVRPTKARLNHKKSKTGCERCKLRKVKCDEQKPQCAACIRHGETCVYNNFKLSPPIRSSASPPVRRSSIPAQPDLYAIPETKAERMRQLRLLHNFYGPVCKNFVEQSNVVERGQEFMATWLSHVPVLAFQHDNLLYAIFSISNTSLLRHQHDIPDLQSSRDRYQLLALQEQRKAVETYGLRNAESIHFAALLIQLNGFAMLQEQLHPDSGYVPILNWLQSGYLAGQILAQALASAGTDADCSKVGHFLNVEPRFTFDVNYVYYNEIPHQSRNILNHDKDELSDAVVEHIYINTLRYLGAIKRSIDGREPSYSSGRRIQGFSLLLGNGFITLLEEGRPRALVILAHLFAWIHQLEEKSWWIGEAPYKAVHAISRCLETCPDSVVEEMQWPRDIVNQSQRKSVEMGI